MQDTAMRERAIVRFNNGERTKILTRNNMKIMKGNKKGYLTTGIHLSPADMISKKTLCGNASSGCKAACLNTSGQGALYMIRKEGRFAGFNTVQESRALRTIWYEMDKKGFITRLRHEIDLFVAKSKREDLIPVIRLNLTSDIPWHRTGIMDDYKSVIFYDYTANLYNDEIPENYFLTFSKKEDNDSDVDKAISRGMNVAVVFDEIPETYKGVRVISGDEDDLRFKDPQGVVIGLKAKGDARKDVSGFVVKTKPNKPARVLIDNRRLVAV